jgi:hypothetical protein
MTYNKRYDPQIYDQVNTAQDTASKAPGKRLPLKVIRKLMITALDNDLRAGINRPHFRCPGCNDRLPIDMGTYARFNWTLPYELICSDCICTLDLQKQNNAQHHTKRHHEPKIEAMVMKIELINPASKGETVLLMVTNEEDQTTNNK